jgi:hypothetical protein
MSQMGQTWNMCEMVSDMAVYGYARVSTDGQSLSAQLAELKAAKCEKIFQEKISGARSDRKQLTRLMSVLAKGDVLVATRLDRLARSTRDLLNLLGTSVYGACILTVPPRSTAWRSTRTLGRRDFLVSSAALAGAAVGGAFTCIEFASAAPIEVPVAASS